MLDYKTLAEENSLYNTPPCWSIYMCGLVFEKMIEDGGLAAVYKSNRSKAGILYDIIDQSSGFYSCPTEHSVRSLMNVPFTIPRSADLEKLFIEEGVQEGNGAAQGAPECGRHAGLHLQLDAPRRRRRPDGVHDGIRGEERVDA